MPKSQRFPSMVLHRPSGQSVVFLRQPDGSRRMVYLGRHGSPEARRRYHEVCALAAAGQPVDTTLAKVPAPSGWPLVSRLVAEFLVHCQNFYRDAEGRPSKTIVNFTVAMEPFVALLRDLPTDQLRARKLLEVQQSMIDSGKFCRETINAMMRRIRQCIRWGTTQELVPESSWHSISALKGIPIGRLNVREGTEVLPVEWGEVQAILQHLPGPVRVAVLLQWECGARPSEILQLTRDSVEFSEPSWTFRPRQHKNKWRGKDRVIFLGPKAQEIVRPYMKLDPGAAWISPRDALAEQRAQKRAERQSPMTPSQRVRDARNARKEPSVGEFYNVSSYRKAIHRACDEAGIDRWSPHRLRHACGTRIAMAEANSDLVAAVLGHADKRMADRYSKLAKLQLAAQTMARHG